MKKILSLLLATAMLLSVMAGCGSSSANSTTSEKKEETKTETPAAASNDGKVYNWTMGTTGPDPEAPGSASAYSCYVQRFVELVNERSNGRLVITPHWNSVLGSDVQLLNDCRDGNIDIIRCNPMGSIDPRFSFKATPYLYADYDQVEELMGSPDGEHFQLMKELVADQNGYLLGVGHGTFRGIFNSKHVVKVPSDLRDLTMRIYEDPAVNAFWTPLCNATILPYNELYTSLQTGVVDGAEIASNIFLSAKFYEVCPYFTEARWQWVGTFTIVNQNVWNELPDDLKEIVEEASWEAAAYENEKEEEFRKLAQSELGGLGTEIYELSNEELAEWQEYALNTHDAIREVVGAETFDRAIAAVDASNAKRG